MSSSKVEGGSGEGEGEDYYYKLLELEVEASDAEVKKAYRLKALQFHPDKNPDNPSAVEMFQSVRKAFDVLSDPQMRKEYDAKIRRGLEARRRREALGEKRKQSVTALEEREALARRQRQENSGRGGGGDDLERLRRDNLRHREAVEEALLQRRMSSNPPPPDSSSSSSSSFLDLNTQPQVQPQGQDLKADDTSNTSYEEETLRKMRAKRKAKSSLSTGKSETVLK